jgi:hypothetical protein
MREFCERLYCAYAPGDALAVGADGRIAFTARVTDHGRMSEHRAEFDGVRGFARRRDAPSEREPGDPLELSVIEIERDEPGAEWRVWLNPWYVEEVEFRCARITLDGLEVTGAGRWLQDELPDRSAV